MFERLTIRTRLSLGFGVVLTLLCLMAGSATWQMSKLADNSNFYAVNLAPSWETQYEISVALADIRRLELTHILSNTESEMDAIEAKIEASHKQVDDKLARYEKELLSDAEDKRDLETTRSAIAGYLAQWEKVRAVSRKSVTDPSQNEVATKLAVGDSAKAYEGSHEALRNWWDYNVKLGKDQDANSQATYGQSKGTMLALTVTALLMGLVAATLLVRSVVRQLGGEPSVAANIATAIADGDLTQHIEVKPGDQSSLISRLAVMQSSLQQVVSNVRQNSESVATASAQIAIGNQDLSQRTEEQASALQQTAATMEQLGQTVRNNADSARQANQMAQGATAVAAQGGEVVDKVVSTMQGISESSRKIGDIIGVIDGIAFQTNILALNAAVEAARAGEQGRGFAVVAGEVRTLAQRSAEAAKEIKTLIGRSVEQVEQGTSLVGEAGKTMAEIVGSIRRVSDIVAEISSASEEQSSGVKQVGDAVGQMDQVTQQNAALVEESAAAAESLKGQAQQLVQTVAVFKVSQHAGPAVHTSMPESRSTQRTNSATRPGFKSKPTPAPVSERSLITSTSAHAGTDDWTSF